MTTDLSKFQIEPTLGQQVVSELADLNKAFLQLMTRLSADVQFSADHRDEQAGQLSRCAVHRLTHCAFALFDLRLDDTRFWAACLSSGLPQRYRDCPISDPHLKAQLCFFSLTGLLYLRHLAGINRFLARISFAASSESVDAIAEIPLDALCEIAQGCPGLLTSRLSKDPAMWPALLRLVRKRDSEPLVPAKILGYQFAAAITAR